jgi:hypothetical protein
MPLSQGKNWGCPLRMKPPVSGHKQGDVDEVMMDWEDKVSGLQICRAGDCPSSKLLTVPLSVPLSVDERARGPVALFLDSAMAKARDQATLSNELPVSGSRPD